MKIRAPNDLFPTGDTFARAWLRRLLSVQVLVPVLTLAASLLSVVVALKVVPPPGRSETRTITTMPRIRRHPPPELPEIDTALKLRAAQNARASTAKRS
jgi:hypothetical protein